MTRWRADGTRDNVGQFCYVKDVTRGHTWSAAHQPMCVPAEHYRALLATDRVTFERTDGDIETRTEIAVVPADAAEVRRVTVTNHSDDETREVELTSYGEIVLAPPDADRAHPAFANLFVETEWHEWCTAITATRRPRSAAERSLWCVHVVDTGEERVGQTTAKPIARASSGADARRETRSRSSPTAPVRHHRRGARSDLRPAHARAARAGPVGIGRVHDAGRDHAGAGLRAGRPLSRPSRGAAGARSGVDRHTGRAQGARRHPGRRRGLPGPGGAFVLSQSRIARPQVDPAEPGLAAAALGQRDLGRLADRAGHHRIARRAADAATGLLGTPLLAPPGHDGGPGGAQRASRQLSRRCTTRSLLPWQCTRSPTRH